MREREKNIMNLHSIREINKLSAFQNKSDVYWISWDRAVSIRQNFLAKKHNSSEMDFEMGDLNTCLNCGLKVSEEERAQHKCIVCRVCFKILKTHDDYVTHLELFKCRPVELCDSCGSPSQNRDDVCMGCVDLYLQNRTVARHKRVRCVDHTFMCERCGDSFSRTCVLVKDDPQDEQEMENNDPQPLYGYHVIIIFFLFLLTFYLIIIFF